ncbi:hypothetical protein E4A47_02480 [Micrococcus flavus]|uniref:hypothetical protein n=1 Tax=Micrococcus flavus TaxID=384602 RepID=UPI0010719181|nr:hypothetical protein [Micrococcus flavus]TFI04514.1 hypothetical protein E4A47_02480 [Micrococcus flavus]
MKKTTLTGSATAALGVVVVAGAGPALAATPLTQGAALSVPAGDCSITIVDDATAYTAAHCGAGEWTIGSPVKSADGTVIGTVAALPGDSGVDAVKIALADDVDVVGEWSVRETATVEPGETVYTHGSSVPLGEPNSISEPETFDIGETCGDVYTDQVVLDEATTRRGDSGGAVYDAEQRVVGIISGLAPVTYDAEGNAVRCDADEMSTIIVPVESLDEVDGTTPVQAPAAQAATVGKHGVVSLTESERRALELEKAEAAAEAKAEKEAVAEKKAAAEAKAEKAAAEKKAAAPAEQTLVVAPEDGIDFRTRVEANTDQGGFSYMAVTAFDADGEQIGHLHLHSDGQPMTWINVPAEVPAGGHIEVELTDAAGEPTDAVVTLGGVPVS